MGAVELFLQGSPAASQKYPLFIVSIFCGEWNQDDHSALIMNSSCPSTLSISSYRLGYNPGPQQAYPGRWTTPTIILVFALLTAFLACINVPLSAYDFVQEVTYRPNDSLAVMPLSRWLPSVLRPPIGSFAPQILTVGDTLTLNNSVFNFTITGAFDRANEDIPVSTFAYFNHPFSDGCDVSNMSLYYVADSFAANPINILQLSAEITCNFPTTRFTSSWKDIQFPLETWDSTILQEIVYGLKKDAGIVIGRAYTGVTFPQYPPSFVNMALIYDIYPACSNPQNSMDPACLEAQPVEIRSHAHDFQLLRDDGESIGPLTGSDDIRTVKEHHLPILVAPNMTSLPQQIIRLYNTSDRVPVMEYSRTVPKLKPLCSAITSVFVSTFAMLSTIWTLFCLVAGALARTYNDRRRAEKEKVDSDGVDFDVEKQEFFPGARSVDGPDKSDVCVDFESETRQRLQLLEFAVKQMQLVSRKRGEECVERDSGKTSFDTDLARME
ncbi:hypothetical protein R3P38DRAFT_3495983 [Favolaschia claudopus]|uniref:Transmembrane protein n=1 Tax=Favolaschia claudopus TaxID=2862362 RepID=A0AAV9Z5V0_9AGAR